MAVRKNCCFFSSSLKKSEWFHQFYKTVDKKIDRSQVTNFVRCYLRTLDVKKNNVFVPYFQISTQEKKKLSNFTFIFKTNKSLGLRAQTVFFFLSLV